MIWNKSDTDMGRVDCDWNKEVKETKPNPYDSNPVVGKCSKCGLEMRRAMMYSCSKQDCPCFCQPSL